METEISKKYSNFRARRTANSLADNEIEEILRSSTTAQNSQAAWEGHKMIGPCGGR
ncbi:MAG: hypothetical protein MZV63_00535 [Marinilabiliales bacterium]|nr:hypothetical protein [Marinilabiliales bacterium]